MPQYIDKSSQLYSVRTEEMLQCAKTLLLYAQYSEWYPLFEWAIVEIWFIQQMLYIYFCLINNLTLIFLLLHLQCSLPESNVSGDQPPPSLGSTDEGSWIQVDEDEAQPTLWVPDHAATSCAKCDTQFWMANRKHHCRYVWQLWCFCLWIWILQLTVVEHTEN